MAASTDALCAALTASTRLCASSTTITAPSSRMPSASRVSCERKQSVMCTISQDQIHFIWVVRLVHGYDCAGQSDALCLPCPLSRGKS